MVVPSTLRICGTRHRAKTSETRQSLYQTLSIPKQTFNPPGNVRSGCGMWTSSSQDLNKDSEGEPKIPEHITCQAACAYDIYGKCTGMLSLERPNILLHAYNQSKWIGLHSTTPPPVQDAATEIVGLLQRYKLQINSTTLVKKQRIQYVLHPEAHYDLPPKMGTSYKAKIS